MIASFDLSLARTGWASPEGCGVLVPPRDASRGMERLGWIECAVLRTAGMADLVVLEGYSFASKGRATFSLGELGGIVRLALWRTGTPFVEVAPGTLKKYATGRGNAGKEEVLAAAIRRLDYQGHDDNEADALWLREMALDYYSGGATSRVPKAHRLALGAVEWPEIAETRGASWGGAASHTPRLDLVGAPPAVKEPAA